MLNTPFDSLKIHLKTNAHKKHRNCIPKAESNQSLFIFKNNSENVPYYCILQKRKSSLKNFYSLTCFLFGFC